MPPYKRDVNTVFQSYALFPHLSVEKNVGFGLERKKVSKTEVNTRVGEALEMVQLGHLAKRKPSQLSGGQEQRVALARALVNRPRALLLDEPLGALDLRLRKQLQIELKRIQQEVGITFVHVTHDQEEAMTMADTIAVMHARQDRAGRPATELYEHPQTEFVANFLGVSNLDRRHDARRATATRRAVETHDGASSTCSRRRCGRRRATSASACGPEKVTSCPSGGEVRADANVAARHGDRGRVPGGLDPVPDQGRGRRGAHRVRPERGAGGTDTLGPGTEVQLAWDTEHTFVVAREDRGGG